MAVVESVRCSNVGDGVSLEDRLALDCHGGLKMAWGLGAGIHEVDNRAIRQQPKKTKTERRGNWNAKSEGTGGLREELARMLPRTDKRSRYQHLWTCR